MNLKPLTAVTLLAAAGTAHCQTARVDVFINDGSTGYIDAVANGNATVDGSNNVTITSIPTMGTEFRVFFTGGLGNLGEIRHNVNAPTIIRLTENDGPLEVTTPPTTSGANNWAGLAGTYPDLVLFAGRIEGDLTGPITARRITQFLAEGDINGDITIDADGAPDGLVNIIRMEAFGDITGDIDVQEGSIDDIVARGSILNTSIVAEDTIGLIIAKGGDIGTTTQAVTIRAEKVNTSPEVNIGIIAGHNIYADITASSSASAKGRFQRIVADEDAGEDGRLGTSAVAGDIVGSITGFDAEYRDPINNGGINVLKAGVFDWAHIFQDSPQEPTAFHTLHANSVIIIQGSVLPISGQPPEVSTEMIRVLGDISAGEGLRGQIIINAANDSSVWTGEAAFFDGGSSPSFGIDDDNSQPHQAPFYDKLPDDLGGGAIGLAPFNFHNKACTPPGDTTLLVPVGDMDIAEVVIEHYGPVADGPGGSGRPVVLEAYNAGTQSWDDVSADFIYTIDGRTITIEPDTGKAWESLCYRASPDDLVCVNVGSGTTTPVYSFPSEIMGLTDFYVFMVTEDNGNCACSSGDPDYQGADTNGDGSITPADFNAWILAYNNSNIVADQNCDTLINPADFNAWIINFNAGCK